MVIVLVLIALFLGKYRKNQSITSMISDEYSSLQLSQSSNEKLFIVQSDSTDVEYIALGNGRGYGGDLSLSIWIDSAGFIRKIDIISQSETYSFIEKIYHANYIDSYLSMHLSDLNNEINIPDAVSGASYTSRGIEDAVFSAARSMEEIYQYNIIQPQSNLLIFGIPEIALILLYALGIYLNYRRLNNIKWIKWTAILVSIVFIGFMGQKMLTLTNIGTYIMGDWPDWHHYFFWYILIVGLGLGIILQNKNHYCNWVCPFGRVQEVLGAIGKARPLQIKINKRLQKLQQLIALIAVLLGLVLRNPSQTSFEVFSGLFTFTGSDLLFISLGIVIIASLFIRNPWCNYLCPVKPCINYLRSLRKMFTGNYSS